MTQPETTDWPQTIAAVVQALAAVAAFYFAHKSNQLSSQSNKLAVDSVRRQQLLGLIAEVVRESREVVPCYRALFDAFDDVSQKVACRTKWLQVRDQVSELLLVYSDAFEVFASAKDQWAKLEELEDSHAMSDQTTSPDIRVVDAAMKRYRDQYRQFLQVLGKSS